MGTGSIYILSVFICTLLSLIYRPGAGLFQYLAEELLCLQSHLLQPLPAELLLHPDITFLPLGKYIHWGACRHFHSGISKPIKSYWSTSRRTQRNTGQVVNHGVLTSLARLANNFDNHDNIPVNFVLLNIQSLMSKGHLIQDHLIDRKLDPVCLTETWQQFLTFHNPKRLLLRGLFTSLNLVALAWRSHDNRSCEVESPANYSCLL